MNKNNDSINKRESFEDRTRKENTDKKIRFSSTDARSNSSIKFRKTTDGESEKKAPFSKKDNQKDDKTISRGDLLYADLSPVIGSEQGGVRPVLVVQNDVGNKFSPTTIVAAITSVKNKTNLPTHVKVGDKNCGLPKESVILLEQVRTIDKKRLKDKIGRIPDDLLKKIDEALRISLSLEAK